MTLIGPSLYGVVGRPSASLPGYNYSPAMRAANLAWNEETLDRFLENPQALVPGSRMSFAGEADAERRRAIIEFLKSR
jgi:cytochrome c